jgi:predicted transposase YbfD/YdcC
LLLRACQARSHHPPVEVFVTLDKEQGWVVQRTTRTWAISPRQRKRFWGGRFTTVIETQRVRRRHDRADRIERVFHLTTHPVTAAQAAGLIRGHWGIENRWHHLRDVGFKEDACQATGRTAAGWAWLRTLTINEVRARGANPNVAFRERMRDWRTLAEWFSS